MPKIMAAPLLLLIVSGCASYTPKDLVVPESVSVATALEEIGCAFRRMREAENGYKVGIIPADMKVVLKVTVSSKDGGKLTVSPSRNMPATMIGSAFSAEAEKTGESQAGRENTIEINFKSLPLYLIDKVATESGKDLKASDLKGLIELGNEKAPMANPRPGSQDLPTPKDGCSKYAENTK